MTSGQARVLVLLLVLLGFEAIKQPAVKQVLIDAYNGVNGNLNAKAGGSAAQPLTIDFKQMVYWGVGALALIALAGPAPDIATWLVVLLLMLVVLSDVETFTNLLKPPTSKK